MSAARYDRVGKLDRTRAALGWSRNEVARQLGCDTGLVRLWAVGKRPTPVVVNDWLQSLLAVHRRLKPPMDWRVLSE